MDDGFIDWLLPIYRESDGRQLEIAAAMADQIATPFVVKRETVLDYNLIKQFQYFRLKDPKSSEEYDKNNWYDSWGHPIIIEYNKYGEITNFNPAMLALEDNHLWGLM